MNAKRLAINMFLGGGALVLSGGLLLPWKAKYGGAILGTQTIRLGPGAVAVSRSTWLRCAVGDYAVIVGVVLMALGLVLMFLTRRDDRPATGARANRLTGILVAIWAAMFPAYVLRGIIGW